MVLPFVCTLPNKIVKILRFLPPKNSRGLFHENGIAKVFHAQAIVVWQNFANVSYHRAEIHIASRQFTTLPAQVRLHWLNDCTPFRISFIFKTPSGLYLPKVKNNNNNNNMGREKRWALRLRSKEPMDGNNLIFCGTEFQTFGAVNRKALGPMALAVTGRCRRLSEEEGRGLGRLLKLISYER